MCWCVLCLSMTDKRMFYFGSIQTLRIRFKPNFTAISSRFTIRTIKRQSFVKRFTTTIPTLPPIKRRTPYGCVFSFVGHGYLMRRGKIHTAKNITILSLSRIVKKSKIKMLSRHIHFFKAVFAHFVFQTLWQVDAAEHKYKSADKPDKQQNF